MLLSIGNEQCKLRFSRGPRLGQPVGLLNLSVVQLDKGDLDGALSDYNAKIQAARQSSKMAESSRHGKWE